jgi:hypothetical protein
VQGFSWPEPDRLDARNAALEPREPWEDQRVGAPDLLEAEGQILILYAGGDDAGIGVAALDPAGNFQRTAAEPILAPAQDWETDRVGSPAVLEDGDGGILLLYTGGDGNGIGLARRAADGSFVRHPPQPLWRPEAAAAQGRWSGLQRLADPDIAGIADDGRLRLFFAAYGVVSGGSTGDPVASPDWSIGLALLDASAPDLAATWDPFGPVLAERMGAGEAAARNERGGSAMPWEDGWRILWAESLPGGGSVLRGAVCP